MANVLWKRVLSAAVLIPALVWAVGMAPPWVFGSVVVALSGGAAWEFCRLFAQAGRVVRPGLSALCCAVVTASFLVPGAAIPVLVATTGVMLASSLGGQSAPSSDGMVIGVVSLCYVGVLMGHALLLQQLPGGRALLIFLLGVTWAGETAAFAVGSLVGRRKLAPRISPGKTVEGAIGQFAASLVTAGALGGLLPEWSALEIGLAGLILGGLGQVGDLTESAIKRSVGVKDAGSAIPGHGGLLDRIDGLLFNTPALFYYAGVLGGRA